MGAEEEDSEYELPQDSDLSWNLSLEEWDSWKNWIGKQTITKYIFVK